MSRYVLVLAAVMAGAVAGVFGGRAWWPAEPVVLAASADESWELKQDIVRLQADNTVLEVDNALLKNDIVRLQEEHQQLGERRDAIEEELGQNEAERQKLEAQLLATEGRLTVEKSAKEHMAEELVSIQQDVGILQQNLAFFEQLIPENSKPAEISIRSAEAAVQGDQVRYRVLVMRNRNATEEFSGSLEFTATGTKDGSSATIPLETSANASISGNTADAASTTSAAPTVLKFKQYQRASGVLDIPPGFEPKSITVRVLEGKTVRSEHTIGLAPKE